MRNIHKALIAVFCSGIFITGIGKVYPYIRAHTLLNALQGRIDDRPLRTIGTAAPTYQYKMACEIHAGFSSVSQICAKHTSVFMAFQIDGYRLDLHGLCRVCREFRRRLRGRIHRKCGDGYRKHEYCLFHCVRY